MALSSTGWSPSGATFAEERPLLAGWGPPFFSPVPTCLQLLEIRLHAQKE